jgi:chromosome segregation ATPase
VQQRTAAAQQLDSAHINEPARFAALKAIIDQQAQEAKQLSHANMQLQAAHSLHKKTLEELHAARLQDQTKIAALQEIVTNYTTLQAPPASTDAGVQAYIAWLEGTNVQLKEAHDEHLTAYAEALAAIQQLHQAAAAGQSKMAAVQETNRQLKSRQMDDQVEIAGLRATIGKLQAMQSTAAYHMAGLQRKVFQLQGGAPAGSGGIARSQPVASGTQSVGGDTHTPGSTSQIVGSGSPLEGHDNDGEDTDATGSRKRTWWSIEADA